MLGGKPLQIATRLLGTTTVFDVTGDIDLAHSPEVRKALLGGDSREEDAQSRDEYEQGAVYRQLGRGVLVEALKASRDAGTRFLLVGLSPAAREVLQLSRLLKIFETFDTEEAALAS